MTLILIGRDHQSSCECTGLCTVVQRSAWKHACNTHHGCALHQSTRVRAVAHTTTTTTRVRDCTLRVRGEKTQTYKTVNRYFRTEPWGMSVPRHGWVDKSAQSPQAHFSSRINTAATWCSVRQFTKSAKQSTLEVDSGGNLHVREQVVRMSNHEHEKHVRVRKHVLCGVLSTPPVGYKVIDIACKRNTLQKNKTYLAVLSDHSSLMKTTN